jgi:hypothetical protein
LCLVGPEHQHMAGLVSQVELLRYLDTLS